ncbi:hypothetical protein ACSFC1_02980 [Pseudothermotoga sp. U03pept]|uniref:hypothetical protein n=1 Tax=Pseudothermotoga sp. U03pept TaxID=3447012 RepID=UPI003F115191
MKESILKFSRSKGFIRALSFAIFGLVAFSKPAREIDLLNVVLSVSIGLFFGGLYHFFLCSFMKPFNRDLRDKYGKKAVKRAAQTGMAYLFPFAAVSLISRFVLGWSLVTPLLSSALVVCAFAAANSVNMLKEKPRVANVVVGFLVGSIFATLWVYYSAFAAKLPIYAEGGIRLLHLFLTNFFKT